MKKTCMFCKKQFTGGQTRTKYCSSKCFGMGYRQPIEERFWRRVHKTDTCWVWTGGKAFWGYGQIWYKGKSVKTHRISWILHFGEPEKGKFILHKCDNPPCVNPDHLFLGTAKDNIDDCIRKGRFKPYGLTMRRNRPAQQKSPGRNVREK